MTGSTEMADGPLDAVVVGAGFAGLYMLTTLREQGFAVRVLETGSDVGGTWYWNRYPGARCDVASLEYSFSFDDELQQQWEWSERFATQPEILAYLNHVADRHDLRRNISFDTTLTRARFDGDANQWLIETDRGEHIRARHLIMATGCLSASRLPDVPGMERFGGEIHHPGRWPHAGVDLAGKRVGVVGVGSSGVQIIPVVAREAQHLYVFQRTPAYVLPARNRALTQEEVSDWKATYAEKRRIAREEARTGWIPDPPIGRALDVSAEERRREYERRWDKGGANFMYAFSDIGVDDAANATAADFVRGKIRDIVEDPAVARLLTPVDYPIGAKRVCVGTDYYETYNRDNVTLVDVRSAPIAAVTETGLRTAAEDVDLDVIIFATGYDAVTGPLTRVPITGAGGVDLAQKWAAGPANYLGIMTADFPNLYMITGPGSPSVLGNVVTHIEQHVEWVAGLLRHMRTHDYDRVEPTPEAEEWWGNHCRELASPMLQLKADSWYVGANVPGKPRVLLPYVGGTNVYGRACREVAEKGYEGFVLSRPSSVSPQSHPARLTGRS